MEEKLLPKYGAIEGMAGECKGSAVPPRMVWGRSPVRAMCFSCGQGYPTTLRFKVSRRTHKASLACCPLLLCWLPYLIRRYKDVYHHCGGCGALLGGPPWQDD